MTVHELITILQKYPQDIQVVYQCFSENCLLEEKDIETGNLCFPRPDGWVQNKRPDQPTQTYLILPGN